MLDRPRTSDTASSEKSPVAKGPTSLGKAWLFQGAKTGQWEKTQYCLKCFSQFGKVRWLKPGVVRVNALNTLK